MCDANLGVLIDIAATPLYSVTDLLSAGAGGRSAEEALVVVDCILESSLVQVE